MIFEMLDFRYVQTIQSGLRFIQSTLYFLNFWSYFLLSVPIFLLQSKQKGFPLLSGLGGTLNATLYIGTSLHHWGLLGALSCIQLAIYN